MNLRCHGLFAWGLLCVAPAVSMAAAPAPASAASGEHRPRAALDRTRPPGQPEGKDYGGYAGLSFRGDRFLRDVAVVTSAGKRDLAANRLPAEWASLTGSLDGRPAGLTVFDHPSNARHPTPWYFVLRPGRGDSPFWYLNAAFLNNEPFALAPERPLTLRYLVRVDSQPPVSAALEAEFRGFASAGKISEPFTP